MPSFLVMLIVYIYVALAAYNTGHLTLPMSSIETIIDDAANVGIVDEKGRLRSSYEMGNMIRESHKPRETRGKVPKPDWRALYNVGTDAVSFVYFKLTLTGTDCCQGDGCSAGRSM